MGLFDLGVDWAAVEAPSFEDIAAGIYEAELASVGEYEKDGRKAITFDFLITEDEAHDGKFVGKTKKEFKYIHDKEGNLDEKSVGYLKARLVDLGANPEADLSDLDPDTLVGTTVALTLKQRGEYVNIASVKRIGEPEVSRPAKAPAAKAAAPAKAGAADEDNPFA